MNKMTIVLIFVLMSIVFFAFNYFISGEPQLIEENTGISPNVNIVKPLDIEDKSVLKSGEVSTQQEDRKTVSDKNKLDFRKPRENGIEADKLVDADSEFIGKLEKNYVTLGEILNRPPIKEGVMENLFEDIQRAKYNLEISKKMAAMTKDIYYLDENGVRQINQETMDKIHELRKKLIVQVNFYNPNSTE